MEATGRDTGDVNSLREQALVFALYSEDIKLFKLSSIIKEAVLAPYRTKEGLNNISITEDDYLEYILGQGYKKNQKKKVKKKVVAFKDQKDVDDTFKQIWNKRGSS